MIATIHRPPLISQIFLHLTKQTNKSNLFSICVYVCVYNIYLVVSYSQSQLYSIILTDCLCVCVYIFLYVSQEYDEISMYFFSNIYDSSICIFFFFILFC